MCPSMVVKRTLSRYILAVDLRHADWPQILASTAMRAAIYLLKPRHPRRGEQMSKKTRKVKKQGAVIVNARDREFINFEDVDNAAKDMKRTKANNATIVVGQRTEVAEDVKDFATKRGVEIATMAPDNEFLPKDS